MSFFYEQMVKAQMAERLAEAERQRPARQLVRARRAERRAERDKAVLPRPAARPGSASALRTALAGAGRAFAQSRKRPTRLAEGGEPLR
jgi:hypothetical protein